MGLKETRFGSDTAAGNSVRYGFCEDHAVTRLNADTGGNGLEVDLGDGLGRLDRGRI